MDLIDRDIVKKYRKWLKEYFEGEFMYEPNMYLTLGKVRDFISNAQISGGELKIREVDLVVKVDGIIQEGEGRVVLKISDQTCK